MHFSSFGSTINPRAIVNAITLHGIPVFHTPETQLKPFLCWDSACNLADIIAVYKQSERFYTVGIDILEQDKRVNPKMAMEYLKTYRQTYDYFYLAAKKFSSSTHDLEDIGLFNLTKMKVVKSSEYLSPDYKFRSNLIKKSRITLRR